MLHIAHPEIKRDEQSEQTTRKAPRKYSFDPPPPPRAQMKELRTSVLLGRAMADAGRTAAFSAAAFSAAAAAAAADPAAAAAALAAFSAADLACLATCWREKKSQHTSCPLPPRHPGQVR